MTITKGFSKAGDRKEEKIKEKYINLPGNKLPAEKGHHKMIFGKPGTISHEKELNKII